MSAPRRVVVTGLGTVNALGANMDQAWQALCNSECNFRVMTEEDHPDYPTSPNPFASPAHKDFKLSKVKERHPDIGSR